MHDEYPSWKRRRELEKPLKKREKRCAKGMHIYSVDDTAKKNSNSIYFLPLCVSRLVVIDDEFLAIFIVHKPSPPFVIS
jgi:hypothetical protein